MILFPAMIALDVRRVFGGKIDILCCWKQSGNTATSLKEVSNNDVNELKAKNLRPGCNEKYLRPGSKTTDDVTDAEAGSERCYVSCGQSSCHQWTLTSFVSRYYSHWITLTPIKVFTILVAVALLVASAYGINKVEDGLDLTDVVPRNTSVWSFLKAQDQYFGFYNMYAVTKDNFEYPQNQQLIYDYHNSFVSVNNIIKDDDGGLPEFWLSLFRTWLVKLQDAYDADKLRGVIDDEGWTDEATDDAVLAYKLLVQTGHVDYPVDKSLLASSRLVEDGIINPAAFYNYLSAWYSNDAMAYSYSQATLEPEPKKWFHDPMDYDLKIPKSKPIKYAQIPFLLNNLGDTAAMVTTIQEVRHICSEFQTRGLPNFPHGIPFTFWEQYIGLRFYLLLALAAALAAVFAVEFPLHIVLSYVGSLGDRGRRTELALEHMFAPVMHGAVSTFLGVAMLAFSQFDFIFRYFFLVLLALILLGVFNGLVLLPVLLVVVGPPAQLEAADQADTLPPATPQPSPARFRARPPKLRPGPRQPSSSSGGGGGSHDNSGFSSMKHKRHNSDISLSTIAEETTSHLNTSLGDTASVSSCEQEAGPGSVQSSYNGTSVFLEPHITVETSTVPATGSSGGSSRSSSPSGGAKVTKVTATAKFKLELHTPVEAASSRPASRRSRRGSAGSRNGDSGSVHSSLELPSSLASSLSSDGGYSEK